MMFTHPFAARLPMGGMTLPAVNTLFDPFPIGPAEQRPIEIAPGEQPDVPENRRAFPLSRFDLVGQQNHLRQQRHRRPPQRVVTHRGQDFIVGDVKSMAKDIRGDRPMQQDRARLIGWFDPQARLARQLELLGGRMRAVQIVSPDRKLGPLWVDVPVRGELQGLLQHSLDMANQPLGPRFKLGPERRNLPGNALWH